MAAQAPGSPAQLRSAIEETRRELGFSVEDLRAKVAELSDWRTQVRENSTTALVVAGAAGFLLGGGLAATVGLFRRS